MSVGVKDKEGASDTVGLKLGDVDNDGTCDGLVVGLILIEGPSDGLDEGYWLSDGAKLGIVL